ncbi:CLAVATA3/ESR-RELATED [Quillaja saponaria]|uniref:CLAVATA3/ESR-RELATED n=1 Tax=Quillaja saponaria TaxID=32244 RepID=A0AAD7QAK1_QUISA|nr:CLAVATA3/ESR-RELATED [Quillaja saponaria]
MLIMSRTQVGYLLLIFLSISALNHEASGTRYLKIEVHLEKPPVWKKISTNETEEGFFATVNREVPSCPDPLHNR